jgi:hypothetical protein
VRNVNAFHPVHLPRPVRLHPDVRLPADPRERDCGDGMNCHPVDMAIGRILRLGSRPTQPGDVEQYEAARAVILAHLAPVEPYRPDWARDRLRGAAGAA